MKQWHARTLSVLGLAAVVFGCGRLEEVKRCRALAQKVNASLDAIESAARHGRNRQAFERIAHEYDHIADGLKDYDAGANLELTRLVTEYAGVARSSARQCTTLAAALGSSNHTAAQVATRELERLARQEKNLVSRIDDECRPK